MSQFSGVKELNELLISNVPKDSLIVSNGIEGESVFINDSTNMSEIDSTKFSQITKKYFLHIHGSREKGFEYEYDAFFGKDLSSTTFYSYVYFEGNIKKFQKLKDVEETTLLKKLEKNWYKWIYVN
jgi:hypothetical protein